MKKQSVRKARATSKARSRPPREGDGWEEELVSRLRRVIEAADPEAIEEQKWKKPSNPEGVPVWYHNGIMCTIGILKNRVRLTFGNGARLKDKSALFNACLDAGSMRGIDIYQGDELDEAGITSLVRQAATLNTTEAQRRGS